MRYKQFKADGWHPWCNSGCSGWSFAAVVAFRFFTMDLRRYACRDMYLTYKNVETTNPCTVD